jgi:hypothetical protein
VRVQLRAVQLDWVPSLLASPNRPFVIERPAARDHVRALAGRLGEIRAEPGSGSHRMVLRAENGETRRTQVFGALVDSDEERPFRPGSPHIMVTLRVVGDDVGELLEIGSHFSLWSGGDVGQGVVTGRLHL